jgi:hypothetical protein
LPEHAVLFVEGSNLARPARELYRKNRAGNWKPVAHDTMFPVSYGYHIRPSKFFFDRLNQLANQFEPENLFHHLKAYVSQSLLFWFHDVAWSRWSSSDLSVSKQIPISAVNQFASLLSATRRSEKVRSRNQFLKDVRPRIKSALRSPQ